MSMTGEELIKEWAKGAKGGQILNMTEPELVEFALKNNFDVREIRVLPSWELIGWRLYETHVDLDDPKGKRRIPDELYYVVRKKVI